MPSRSTVGHTLSIIALAASLVAVLVLLLAGPGTRVGIWDFRVGLSLLRWVALAGFTGIGLGLVGLIAGGARAAATAAVVLGLAAAAVPLGFMRRAQSVPPIHDISTDTEDPPPFVAVLAQRTGAANPAEYGGPEVAAQQHVAYPDLKPAVLPQPPAQAFDRALAAARGQGWAIVAAEPAQGRIEATDTTTWFGFKDDVVVRIRPDGAGSRLDVRSLSRVGRSDVGTNARRIRQYLQALHG